MGNKWAINFETKKHRATDRKHFHFSQVVRIGLFSIRFCWKIFLTSVRWLFHLVLLEIMPTVRSSQDGCMFGQRVLGIMKAFLCHRRRKILAL